MQAGGPGLGKSSLIADLFGPFHLTPATKPLRAEGPEARGANSGCGGNGEEEEGPVEFQVRWARRRCTVARRP